ncbi:ferredoxin-NADP reductase/predicted pyridoxine 5'-phosphate oxidase superfamily flavin-nucleotide-binding protein/ferredoxin [Rhizobium sp. SG_E_25_P2]|uniref:2Fe-2S iron-sulfur cluster-binding protein n=1 Tax=Rhizobium sp. SG_E_25_P2 TaxID=2879942 RepID=UPI002476C50D|nr:pyridoxamine 5'-phosphate oxidase family protein [Rhizobium sp. SG_E_25_P2]MDH6265838.1 ferredoxin-NADP reductase/predicted pyridoxine 5'-phosphate oxidase superfamily flavin-nucleotide-binding protein/ferredoxin [Rhizobium sp. SG_E_25_P2]
MSEFLEKLPVWHEGERRLQEKVGAAERMAAVGPRVVRDFMPDQHSDFYAQLPFIVLGSVDRGDDAWATLIEGQPGFITSPSPTALEIGAFPGAGDPAGEGIVQGKAVGLLGIEMLTRRRNRMNGVVASAADHLQIEVDQSFGNCPRYIQLRDVAFARAPHQHGTGEIEELTALDAPARELIASADVFFVASFADRDKRRQVDVSHRGGKTGFVRVSEEGVLTVPDFDGNLFFSTLGNILLNGKAGLLFVDFATGDVLQMSGDAEVILDSPEIAAFQGAERLWTFAPRRIMRRRNALALRWTFRADGWSPSSLMTGDWRQVADRLTASGHRLEWQRLTVTKIIDESTTIRSFYLEPAEGGALAPHLAGQHLPIRLVVPGGESPLIRTYTLSDAPSDGVYRISVRRDGLVSRHLHDVVRVGDVIEARTPGGDFTIDAHATRPAVLLAGGVGVTPLISMLRHVVFEGVRKQRMRQVILFQAARSKQERPFDREIAELVDAGRGAIRLVRVLSDPVGAEKGRDYDEAGRIDMALLRRNLTFDDYDFYLCGPPQFAQALYDGLRAFGLVDARIHTESFGPSAVKRSSDANGVTTVARRPQSTRSAAVLFVNSLKEARWTPGAGTLLDLAEARGLQPEFGCRAGSCGACRSRLIAGEVAYVRDVTASVGEGEVLLCSTAPAEIDRNGENRIELAL